MLEWGEKEHTEHKHTQTHTQSVGETCSQLAFINGQI